MSDEVSAQDIEDQVAADVESGVQSFSDGTSSVTAMDPEKRLKVADRLNRRTAASGPAFGMGCRQLIPGGTG